MLQIALGYTMKQVLTTILAILYLATSSGAAITIHYCMGKVVTETVVEKKACGKCGMEKKGGCCEDKVKLVKTQDNHSFQTAAITFASFTAILQTNYIVFTPGFAVLTSAFATHNNSPPDLSGISLFIRNCVFRL